MAYRTAGHSLDLCPNMTLAGGRGGASCRCLWATSGEPAICPRPSAVHGARQPPRPVRQGRVPPRRSVHGVRRAGTHIGPERNEPPTGRRQSPRATCPPGTEWAWCSANTSRPALRQHRPPHRCVAATVVVTMTLDALFGGLAAALSAAVLGSTSGVLDLGRKTRFQPNPNASPWPTATAAAPPRAAAPHPGSATPTTTTPGTTAATPTPTPLPPTQHPRPTPPMHHQPHRPRRTQIHQADLDRRSSTAFTLASGPQPRTEVRSDRRPSGRAFSPGEGSL